MMLVISSLPSLAAAPNHRQGHLVSSGDVDVAVVGVAVPGLELQQNNINNNIYQLSNSTKCTHCILRRRGVVAVDHC